VRQPALKRSRERAHTEERGCAGCVSAGKSDPFVRISVLDSENKVTGKSVKTETIKGSVLFPSSLASQIVTVAHLWRIPDLSSIPCGRKRTSACTYLKSRTHTSVLFTHASLFRLLCSDLSDQIGSVTFSLWDWDRASRNDFLVRPRPCTRA
jgi:hypothetical protein